MSPTDNDAFSRLWWGCKRYWPVLLLGLLLGLVASGSGPAQDALSSTPRYEASALVVASALEINPEQLGRTADAIFNGGAVAEVVAEDLGDVDVADVIPERVRLEPVVDTVALRVVGVDARPAQAAELANLAAGALVDALNDIGPGLGAFVVQDLARTPTATDAEGGVVVPVLVGAFGGLLLGLSVVGLLLVLRRPVLSVEEAAAVTGGNPIAVLTLQRRGRTVVPEGIGGLALLGRRLLPAGEGSAALVGAGADRAVRLEITRLLARLVARRRHVYVLAAEEDRGEALDDLPTIDARVTVVTSWLFDRLASVDLPLRTEIGDAPVIFTLSAADYDVPQLLPENTRVALLVAEGARTPMVEAAAAQFVPNELLGVVFVRRRRGRRARGDAASGAPPSRPAGSKPSRERGPAATAAR